MAEILFQRNGVTSIGTVESEEDLNPAPGININPPPSDGRCACCGRHISELKPYGKASNPLMGDFSDALLVKRWRAAGPHDEEAENAINEALSHGVENILEHLLSKCGKEKLKELHDAGATVTMIAKQMRVSKAAISKMLKKMGLAMAAVTTMELAPKIAAKKINALEQKHLRQRFLFLGHEYRQVK